MERYIEKLPKSEYEIARELLFMSGNIRRRVGELEEKLDDGTLTGEDIRHLAFELEVDVYKKIRETLSLSDSAVDAALDQF